MSQSPRERKVELSAASEWRGWNCKVLAGRAAVVLRVSTKEYERNNYKLQEFTVSPGWESTDFLALTELRGGRFPRKVTESDRVQARWTKGWQRGSFVHAWGKLGDTRATLIKLPGDFALGKTCICWWSDIDVGLCMPLWLWGGMQLSHQSISLPPKAWVTS